MDKVRFCQQPCCTGLAVNANFCPKHKTDNYRANTDRARKKGSGGWYALRIWRDGLRPMKLGRNPICEIEGCGKPATDVHHLDSSWKRTRNWELFLTLENLQSLCHEHHSRITHGEVFGICAH